MCCWFLIGTDLRLTIPLSAEDPYSTEPAFLMTSMPETDSIGKKLNGTDPTSPASIGISSKVTMTLLPAP